MPRADRRPELLVLASNVAGECRRCIALVATTAEAVSRWEGIALFVRILSVFIVWSILLPGWHLCAQHGDPRPPS